MPKAVMGQDGPIMLRGEFLRRRRFPEGMEWWLDTQESCDLREQNEGCWGWNPSYAHYLCAQDIVRCP